MEQLLYILPALACPVGMGLMMWFMMRGRGHGSAAGTPEQEQELAQLRAQVQALRPTVIPPAAFDERHPAPAAEKSTPA